LTSVVISSHTIRPCVPEIKSRRIEGRLEGILTTNSIVGIGCYCVCNGAA
jgi:hypothetical protein